MGKQNNDLAVYYKYLVLVQKYRIFPEYFPKHNMCFNQTDRFGEASKMIASYESRY